MPTAESQKDRSKSNTWETGSGTKERVMEDSANLKKQNPYGLTSLILCPKE